jgi:chromosome segregation ATPase
MCLEEDSTFSGHSYSLEMMEEGNTPMKGHETPVETRNSCNPQSDTISRFDTNEKCSDELYSLETPKKVSFFRSKLVDAELQLKNSIEEKQLLKDSLEEAKQKIIFLSSSLEGSIIDSKKARRLEEERNTLEQSLLNLRCHADNLELRIKILEEDRSCLSDDAAARGYELVDAKNKIEALEREAAESFACIERAENANLILQKKLLDVESRESVIKSNSDNYLKSLRNSEACREQSKKTIQKLENDVEEHVSMICKLQESLDQANEQVCQLKLSYMNCNEELATVTETKVRLETSNFELRSTVASLKKELSHQSRSTEASKFECDELRSKLESTEDAYDALHEDLVKMGAQVDDLCSLNAEYQTDLDFAKECMREMDNDIATSKQNIQFLESKLKERENELDIINMKNKNSEAKISKLEEQIHENNMLFEKNALAKNEELETIKAQLNDALEKIEDIEIDQDQISTKHTVEVGALQEELAGLQERYEAQRLMM